MVLQPLPTFGFKALKLFLGKSSTIHAFVKSQIKVEMAKLFYDLTWLNQEHIIDSDSVQFHFQCKKEPAMRERMSDMGKPFSNP